MSKNAIRIVPGEIADIATSPLTPIPAKPFIIAPAIPQGARWGADLGVVSGDTQVVFIRVRQIKRRAKGQYTVDDAGRYTFSTADHVARASVYISFMYLQTPKRRRKRPLLERHP